MTFNFDIEGITPGDIENKNRVFNFNYKNITPDSNISANPDSEIPVQLSRSVWSDYSGIISDQGILTYSNTYVPSYQYCYYICENFPADTEITDDNNLLNTNLMIKIRFKKYASKSDGAIFLNINKESSKLVDRTKSTILGNDIYSRWGSASGSIGNTALNIPISDNIYYDFTYTYDAEKKLNTWQIENIETGSISKKSTTAQPYWKGYLAIGSLNDNYPHNFFGEVDTKNCFFKIG